MGVKLTLWEGVKVTQGEGVNMAWRGCQSDRVTKEALQPATTRFALDCKIDTLFFAEILLDTLGHFGYPVFAAA